MSTGNSGLYRQTGCDLVWASASRDDVIEVVRRCSALPRLPVADLPAYGGDIGNDRRRRTKALVQIADGQRFVWVGDAGAALLHKAVGDICRSHSYTSDG